LSTVSPLMAVATTVAFTSTIVMLTVPGTMLKSRMGLGKLKIAAVVDKVNVTSTPKVVAVFAITVPMGFERGTISTRI